MMSAAPVRSELPAGCRPGSWSFELEFELALVLQGKKHYAIAAMCVEEDIRPDDQFPDLGHTVRDSQGSGTRRQDPALSRVPLKKARWPTCCGIPEKMSTSILQPRKQCAISLIGGGAIPMLQKLPNGADLANERLRGLEVRIDRQRHAGSASLSGLRPGLT